MATQFTLSPPLSIPYQKQSTGSTKRIRNKEDVQESFWKSPEISEYAERKGVYIFALRASKGFRPWYVGKTTNSFKKECFTPHKLEYYNRVLFDGRKGTPVMFFVLLPTKRGKTPARDIDDLETFLIQMAKERNDDVQNDRKTKMMPNWSIAGVLRSKPGKPNDDCRKFKKMLNL